MRASTARVDLKDLDERYRILEATEERNNLESNSIRLGTFRTTIEEVDKYDVIHWTQNIDMKF